MALLYKFLLFFILLYLAVGAFLYFKQDSFLYYPTPKIDGISEELSFDHQGETLKIITLNQGKEKALLYFGGNAEAVAYNAQALADTLPDHTIYLLNYRGYGGSTGKPSEKANFADALVIYEMIKPKHVGISLMGRSLGTGVASYLASIKMVDKLVLVTPYDSIQNVAQAQLPMYPMSILLKDKYNSAARVKDINAEILLLIAEYDQVIKRSHSDKLIEAFKAANKKINIEVIAEKNHNNITADHNYYTSIAKFLHTPSNKL